MQDGSTGLVFPARLERKFSLEEQIRAWSRERIEALVQEEFDLAMGASRYERVEERRGYRKGPRPRQITTALGQIEMSLPRGEFFAPDSQGRREWRSELLPRYARRTEAVEEALLGSYLCGVNTRKIRRALSPLLRGAALSKSTVSRLVARLEESFHAWKGRDLSGEGIALLFLDGLYLKIRLAEKVHSIPVLSAVGVREDGSKLLLSLEVRTSESGAAWKWLTEDLARRGVKAPVFAAIDGSAGLEEAVRHSWPWIEVQRCTKHKLENLYTHAPRSRWEEVKAEYHRIVYAESREKAREAWKRFEKKWEPIVPAMVKSLQEGGEDLLTFFGYPRSMWKSLRTTNGIERLNGEFRRRVKTQGSFPNAQAGLRLLYGLLAAGLLVMNRIQGWRELRAAVIQKRMEMGLIKAEKKVAS